MLMRRWERSRQGDGQLVMIVGEPGLGKSRLIEELHARLRETPHTWVEWSCSQLLQNTPLHPIAEWGHQRFGGADVLSEERLVDLESTLAQVKLDPTENVPLLAPLLDIPIPADRAPALAPEELRRRQLAALTHWVMAGAKVQPVVLAFEDLQWADPTTLDVLRGIAERGALAPLLVVATARPEFRPPWSMRSHHGTMSLAPLDSQQVREMVVELSARHALPRDVVDDVAARSGGVPLFVEEVTRLLLERGEHGGIHTIPPTLQQSLMARLDRLGPAREVAQIGSVIGRGFSFGLLREVAGMQDAALQTALERLADADIVLVQGLPPDSDYRFKHALIQDAAYENLLKSRRQVLHRRVAEFLRDRFGARAAAEPEILAHHFTQAGLTDAAIEWWGKAGDQALRRSAFQEAISHLGKAIEMADKAGQGGPRVAATTAPPSERLKLQTHYAQAVMLSRGFGSEESKAAFTRARELTVGIGNAAERFATYYGLWVGTFSRGELAPAREAAETFRREAENEARMTEATVGSRILGVTCLWQGDFTAAQAHLEQALRLYDPERDREAKFRFGSDPGAAATAHLAHASWQLGEIRRARELIGDSVARAVESAHAPTLANTYHFNALFEIIRGDAGAARDAAQTVVELSREHGLALFLSEGTATHGWARARLGDRETGVRELRESIAAHTEQGNKLFVPFYHVLLAELEAEGQGVDGALTRLDEALALAGETGAHWTDAFLHHSRGEILLKGDPANIAPAEEAFLTAIAIARQQKARSFELRAALALARLYQSTNRVTDGHAVLAPALEGFSPTSEFSEIEQAQTLLAALAQTDEVKSAAISRQRRLQLQNAYSRAIMNSRGYGAEETMVAFTRAQELETGVDNADERFATHHGLWAGRIQRGELALARENAETFLREAENAARLTEVVVGCRLLGLTCLSQGDFVEAQASFMQALWTYDRDRDRESKFRFNIEPGAGATAFLAHTRWLFGEAGQARELIEEAVARAVESDHVPTVAYITYFKVLLELLRGDAGAAQRATETLVEISRQHGTALFLAVGAMSSGWARARLGDRETGATELRTALAAFTAQGNKLWVPFFQGLLAEIEAEGQDVEGALARIDDALALAGRTGEHRTDAFLHRIRGEILLKPDPTSTAPAEQAFLTAIAISQQQKARSFELGAALSLAKLYHSTDRAADAHVVLAPALEGFSPTVEFPEIAEAQTLLGAVKL
jgi:predicted ATPase